MLINASYLISENN